MSRPPLSAGSLHRFADISHRLPPKCWARWRNTSNDGEFDDELVLVFDGPLSVDALDLDDPFGDGRFVFLIVVDADLTVASTIGNQDTDGATGLIVTGNLTCRNAVVGGQQIYVCGDLHVGDLFWGDYNHGTLIVDGSARARMLITTDGYDVAIVDGQTFERAILDEHAHGESWRLDDPAALGEYIDPACILDVDGTATLHREAILATLRAGGSVVRDLPPPRAVPAASDLDVIDASAIVRVVSPALLPAGGDERAVGSIECWVGNTFCRLGLYPDGKRPVERKLYFQHEASLAVLVGLFNAPPTFIGRLWANLRRAAGRPAPQHLGMIWRDMAANGRWRLVDAAAPEAVQSLLATGWDIARRLPESRGDIDAAVTPQALRALLALPLAEPYDDFGSDDRNGLWVGNTYCAFRQADDAADESPLLRVTVQEDDTDLHFYEIVRMADGREVVDIRIAASLGSDDDAYAAMSGGAPLRRAISLFRTASHNLQRTNADLLAGQRVSDDGFALKHWRQRGYLPR